MRIDSININYCGNKRGERCTVTLSEVTEKELETLKQNSQYFDTDNNGE